MFTIEESIFIKRPKQEVFEFVSDISNTPRWQSNVVSSEWTSEGPAGIGSTFRTARRFLGRDIEATVEYTAWDPPHQYTFRAADGPIPVEGTAKFEAKDGGALYTVSTKVEAGGFFRLAEGLVKKQLHKQTEAALNALKLLLEAGEG